MAREKEIKIQLIDLSLDSFIKRIQEKGFKLLHEIEQEDIYFDTSNWYLYEHIASLRLRKVGGKDDSFCFKKVFYLPNRVEHYYIEEVEVKFPIEDKKVYASILQRIGIEAYDAIPKTGDELITFLRKYGYLDEQHMPKVRKVFVHKGNEIVIDDVDRVGIIIELECKEEEPMELVRTFLKEGEWERGVEGTGYIWLTKVKGLSSHIANLKRFHVSPSWNVWDNEMDMYNSLDA